jgi:hypothetical protein
MFVNLEYEYLQSVHRLQYVHFNSQISTHLLENFDHACTGWVNPNRFKVTSAPSVIAAPTIKNAADEISEGT